MSTVASIPFQRLPVGPTQNQTCTRGSRERTTIRRGVIRCVTQRHEGDGEVYEGDGEVYEGDGEVYEGDREVYEGDGEV